MSCRTFREKRGGKVGTWGAPRGGRQTNVGRTILVTGSVWPRAASGTTERRRKERTGSKKKDNELKKKGGRDRYDRSLKLIDSGWYSR